MEIWQWMPQWRQGLASFRKHFQRNLAYHRHSKQSGKAPQQCFDYGADETGRVEEWGRKQIQEFHLPNTA